MKKRWGSAKRYRLVAVTFLAIFAALSSFLFAQASFQENDQQSLGNSGTLGYSSQDGLPVFYQFVEGEDNKLTLALLGDVGVVKMTPPLGGAEESARVDQKSVSLGDSGKSLSPKLQNMMDLLYPSNPEVDQSPNLFRNGAILGASGAESSTEKVIEVKDEEFLNIASQVIFQLGEDGVYEFDMFDTQGEWIARLPYGLYSLQPGEMSVKIVDAAANNEEVNVLENTSYQLNYVPRGNDKAEVIRIHLPPGFTLNGNPSDIENVTTKLVQDYAYDYDNYYAAVPNSAKYVNWRKTNLTGSIAQYNYFIELTLGPQVKNEVVLTYSLKSARPAETTVYLPSIMVDYGTEYNKVPLATVVDIFEADGKTTYKRAQHVGFATVYEPDKILAYMNNAAPYNRFDFNYNNHRTSFGLYTNSEAGVQVTGPHYPMSNSFYYVPYVEGEAFESYNAPLEVLNLTLEGGKQKKYKKYAYEQARYLNLSTVNVYFTSNMLPWYFDDDTSILEGITHELGDVFHSYTYRGVDSGLIKVRTLADFTTKSYATPPTNDASYLNLAGKFDSISTDRLHDSADTFKSQIFYLGKAVRMTAGTQPAVAIPGVLKEATLSLHYPEDTSVQGTTKMTLYNVDNAYKPKADFYPTSATAVASSGTKYPLALPAFQTSSTVYAIEVPVFSEKIHTLEFEFDHFWPNQGYYFDVELVHGVVTAPKSVEYEVRLTSKTGQYIKGYSSPTPTYADIPSGTSGGVTVPKTFVIPNAYRLIPGRPDPLKFGIRSSKAHDAAIERLNDYGIYSLPGPLKGGGNSILTEHPTLSKGGSRWAMSFKTTEKGGQDYENIKIAINPVTENDKKLISKVSGVQNYGLNTAIVKGNVHYTSNLKPGGNSVNWAPNGSTILPLVAGEYVTSIYLTAETLRSSEIETDLFNIADNYDYGEYIFTKNSAEVLLLFNRTLNYFNGDRAKEIPIPPHEIHQLQAVFTTDTLAQHINDPSNPNASNTSTAKGIEIQPYSVINANAPTTSSSVFTEYMDGQTMIDGNEVALYQGSVHTLRMRGLDRVTVDFTTDSASLEYYYQDVERDIYLEVNKYVDILEIEGYQFVSKKPLDGTDFNLYHFQGTPVSAYYATLNMSIYIHPGAPKIEKATLISNLGISFSSFRQNRLQPDAGGDDDYFYKAPHYQVVFNNGDGYSFPANWGVTQDVPNQIFINYRTRMLFRVEFLAVNGMIIQPTVLGGAAEKTSSFQEKNREDLGARAWLINKSDVDVLHYVTEYELPREGTQGTGPLVEEKPTFYTNKFSVYLRGEAVLDPEMVANSTVTYLDDSRAVIPLANLTTPNQWKLVKTVSVYAAALPSKAVYSVELPLTTDHQKVGDNTAELSSFVSACSFIQPPAAPRPGLITYVRGAEYVYQSYEMKFRTGMDVRETGELDDSATVSAGHAKVFYRDNGVEKVLYDSSYSGFPVKHSVLVNNDVSSIEVTPRDAAKHRLTQEGMLGIPEEINSNIPRGTGKKAITLRDVEETKLNLYDAALIRLPLLSTPNITLKIAEVLPTGTSISFDTLGGHPEPPVGSYTKTYTVANATIATIDVDGKVTGVKNGTTTYTYTVTNLLGDVVTSTGTITVRPPTIPVASITKKLSTGGLSDPSAQFTFELWSQPGRVDKQTFTIGLNGTASLNNALLYDTTYYIEEVNVPLGFAFDKFELWVNGSQGVANTRDGIITFLTSPNINNLEIRTYNSTPRYDMKLEKRLLPLGGNHDYARQFRVSVKAGTSSVFQGDVKADGTLHAIQQLIIDQEYIISEPSSSDYNLTTVEILNTSGVVGTLPQPVKVDAYNYKFTFTKEHENATIVVKNTPTDMGSLRLVSVSNLDYGSHKIGTLMTPKRETNMTYVVSDTRVVTGIWKLNVKASDMGIKSGVNSGYVLPYQPLYFSKDGVNKVSVYDVSVPIDSGSTILGQSLQSTTWLPTDANGITFEANNAALPLHGGYESTLTWTLETS